MPNVRILLKYALGMGAIFYLILAVLCHYSFQSDLGAVFAVVCAVVLIGIVLNLKRFHFLNEVKRG